YTDTYEFFIVNIQFPGNHMREASDLVEEKLPVGVTIREIYPQLLADLFHLGEEPKYAMDQYDWNHLDHEKVAHLFDEHATEKGYPEDLIQHTIQFWCEYCHLKDPIVHKYAAIAAALDYFSQVEFLPFTEVTQDKLAKEYGTSAGTISNHYNKLVNEYDVILTMEESESTAQSPPNMEKHMRDLHRLLEEQEFESEGELHDFLQRAMELDDLPSSDDPRDIAQDLLFEAKGTSGVKRKQLIQEALDVFPLSADAYLLLAEEEGDMDKRMKLLEQAIHVGEQDLGTAFFKENRGYFWGIIETRPYMRAKATYGMALENLGFVEEAIDAYIELLELNPNDNQGIRYSLLPLYL